MLPRSCLRLADSKSNSSTRLPRRTTTRVSSGWVASISILLGIDQSLDRKRPHSRVRAPHGRPKAAQQGTCLTVVEWKGRQRASVERSRHCTGCDKAGGVAARRRLVVIVVGFDAWSEHDPRAHGGSATLPYALPQFHWLAVPTRTASKE